MKERSFIKNLKNKDRLKNSFNSLAEKVFGINFEGWYEKGYWNEKYTPFSYVDGNQVVANVSVNKMDLIINRKLKRGLQIGTVMTHPDYRNQGLSASLMNKVLEEYENEYDVMYLFANHSVLDYYPKFGFTKVNEYQFSMDFRFQHSKPADIQKLDVTNSKDLHFIHDFSSRRLPVSDCFGTINTQYLLMFYCLNVISEDLYYLPEENVIVIYKLERNELHVFDLISEVKVDVLTIIDKMALKETDKVIFYFTPAIKDSQLKSELFHGSEVLFVRTYEDHKLPAQFKHPLTSQA
ncbi:GNAT family N-acetyltransferase [Jeotgalibacillus soli]|uniref:N-acetyltransferase domain-containing protein n=1 Tax=Jeotgalibacillus soli TaxID=889306 RepID=A0A0C2W7B1_9BACL|nr:GNAT family N-acetyltransferase [Jeotgalibacillus soli]KIL51928.1 hypothetical protein KP78_02980 [Jeotgalibacillus soli]